MHGYYFYQFQAAGLITDRVVSGSYNASNFNISIPVCKTAVKMFFIQSSEVNFIFCFSLNPLEPCPLPQEEQYIVTISSATTIPIIHVQILTLVENEQSIFDMMFINHHLLSQSSTILLVQILTLVEKDAKERMLKFQASSPDSYFYVYRCTTPHNYHFN